MSKRSQPKRLRDDDSEECGNVAEEKRCQVKVPWSIDQFKFLISFLRLFEDKTIEMFLCMDLWNIIADRYLLAMVYVISERRGWLLSNTSNVTFSLPYTLPMTLKKMMQIISTRYFNVH